MGSSDSPSASRPAHLFVALLLAALIFLCIAPTLAWSEFAFGVEKLNIATALELRRSSAQEGAVRWKTWLVPTLEAEPRIRKPPMNAWLTALAIDPRVVEELSSLDPSVRESARGRLQWQTRWPALLQCCLALIAIYLLSCVLFDSRIALVALLIASTTLYFLRFSRHALTDVPLFLWVTVANAGLAAAVMRGKRWTGWLIGGFALGLAIMNKGPVCLLQTLIPIGLFEVWRRRRSARENPMRTGGLPLVAGLAVMAIVGVSWFAVVAMRFEGTWEIWWKEVMRTDEVEKATGTRLDYLSIFGYLMPWTIFFIGGLMDSIRALRESRQDDDVHRQSLVLLFFLILVPIVVMSCFRDRKERYLLPLLGPSAILIAQSLVRLIDRPKLDAIERAGVWGHWMILLALAVGLGIATATPSLGLATVTGGSWFPMSTSVLVAAGGLVAVVLAALWGRRNRWSLVFATAVIVLIGQTFYQRGYTRSDRGVSEMKPVADLIWREHHEAEIYNLRGDGRRKMHPNDLSIYANRVSRIVPTAADIPSSDRAQVYTELWDRPDREAEPQPASGWTYWTRVPRGRGWWIVFIRPPAS